MSAYPIQLQLAGRLCVVVGGGRVGARKACGLLAAGAQVRLVEPREEAPACSLAGVERVARPFAPEDLEGALLVFAATDAAAVNARVAEEAQRRGLLVNRADDPSGGDFTLPALLRRGELLFAVSSGGANPALAAAVRDHLAGEWGEAWTVITAMARALRHRQLTPADADAYNHAVVRALLDERLPALVAAGDWPAVERHLQDFLGAGVSLADLGLTQTMDET